MTKGKVLVTGWPLLPPAEALLKDAGLIIVQSSPNPSQAELVGLLSQHRPVALIVRTGVIDCACLEADPDLKVIANHGAGYDEIDVDAATKRGIPVFAAPGRNAISVAEHVFALLLAVRKKVISHDAIVREGQWRPATPDIGELHGRAMGIIGLGAIGERVAHLAAAFGMNLRAYDPGRSRPFPEWIQRCEALSDILQDSDVISLHVPLTETTHNMIDKKALARMRRGAILINAARGGVIDESALVAAIDKGQLLGAGLDTFAQEPPSSSSPIARCPAIVLSPHIAGVTPESALRLSLCCAENVTAFLVDGVCSNDLVNRTWTLSA